MSGRFAFDGADDTDWGEDLAPADDHRTGPPSPTATRPADAAHRFAALRETLRQAAERSGER